MLNPGSLDELTREQLIDLLIASAKNLIAVDGVWFQAVEKRWGMDAAMECNDEAWERYGLIEGRRMKKVLELGEHSGLEGLEQALRFRSPTLAFVIDIVREDDALVVKVLDCRVQSARTRKGMGLHPCKSTGTFEYSMFAKGIDERITCTCVSCYPEITDDSVACIWRFTMETDPETYDDPS